MQDARYRIQRVVCILYSASCILLYLICRITVTTLPRTSTWLAGR